MEVALAIVAMADQIHSEFLRLLWVLADKQTRNYYTLVRILISVEDSCGVEFASFVVTRTQLARPLFMPLPHASTSQAGQPMFSTDYLMHCAAHVSHHAPPRPSPPCSALNVGVGAHSVASSGLATRAGASGEADVFADGILACCQLYPRRLPMVSQPLSGLVAVMSTQVVQVPILVLLMMASAPASRL